MTFKELLKTKGIKQKELAKALSLRTSTVSMWAAGKSKPSIPLAYKIAEVSNIDFQEIANCFEK